MYKLKKYKDSMIVTVVTIILIVIISVSSSGREKVSRVESALGKILVPIQRASTNLGSSASDIVDTKISKDSLREENELLKKEVIELKDKMRKQEIIIERKDFLEKEYKLLENTEYMLTKAEIVGKDPGNWVEKFVINKGTRDGIKKGDIVVQGVEMEKNVVIEGLVGRVVGVGDTWAKVISIIDNGSSVSFIDSRTQDGGIARGNFEGKIAGELFDMKSSVNKGDKIFSSGLGGVIPKNIYIGEIHKVTKSDDNLLLDVEITPAVNFNKLKDVFVLKKD